MKGRWSGWISLQNDTLKNSIGFNLITKDNDSVFGTSTVNWTNRISSEIFGGTIDRKKRKIFLYEPADAKGAGVYEFNFSGDSKLKGTWTRNKDNQVFNCQLEPSGDIFPITGKDSSETDPKKFISRFFALIDYFSNYQTEDISSAEDSLKKAYNMWFSPEARLGDFSKFKFGFNNTLSDAIAEFKKIETAEQVFSIIVVNHVAKEYVPQGDSFRMQTSQYENSYKLINVNGKWKIITGRASLVNRYIDRYFTKEELPNQYKKLDSEIFKINSVTPEGIRIGDTVIVSYSISNVVLNTEFISGDTLVYIDNIVSQSKSEGDSKLKVIIPEGITNSDADLIVKIGKISSSPYKIKVTMGIPLYLKIIGAVIILGLLAVIFYVIKRNKKLEQEKAKISQSISQILYSPEDIIQLPDPEVPTELIDACKNRECVLFTASELSSLAGYPLWVDFIYNLIKWAVSKGYFTNDQKDLLISSIKMGRVEQAADSTFINLASKKADINEYISEVYLKPEPEIPDIFNTLVKIPFTAAISSNFDNLLERVYGPAPTVFTPGDTEAMISALNNRDFFILKLYGRAEEPSTLILGSSQFEDTVRDNLLFGQFIETVFYSRTVFCVGADVSSIERFLNNIRSRGISQKKHFALVGVKGRDWKASADILEKRYGVNLIPYTYGNNEQVQNFINKLSAAVPMETGNNKKRPDAPIKKVILENIGPFENLELTLDNHWNILLGDNGVGKSSILKAIAIGIIGKDAEPYAHRLVRTGTTRASITIETENGNYRTDIGLRLNKAEISTYRRLLDGEGWLALGFPPLRTIAWETSGDIYAGQSVPIPEDVEPIIIGEADPRMDKLKRWLIDLKGSSTGLDKDDTRTKNKEAKLIEKFFNIIDELTPNLIVKYAEIIPKNKIVKIRTEDGEIPIEGISQGTLSLISWVGILLQRLYEVYGETEADPTKRFAVVLMDEIDAHMHPAWQQTIIYYLNKVFPNIQFVVSTHSPLVVGGMPPHQILRFARDTDGKVIKIPVQPYDTVGRADQLLTGSLFNLNTTIDKVTQEEFIKYQKLLGITNRSPEEEQEFRRLEKILQFRIPVSAEQPAVRAAQELVQELLQQQFGDEFPDAQQRLIERVEKLLRETQNQKQKI